MVLGKEDTIAPILSKVYTGNENTSSVNLGINPYPLSILSAQFTFLPLTQLHTTRNLIPVARFNVPMTNPTTNIPVDSTTDTISESVARVAGYIAAGETYSSLKPELLRIINESGKQDAYAEYRRIELKSHQKWMGMEFADRERTDSVVSDFESVRRFKSGESTNAKSVNSDGARSSGSLEGYVQVAERGEAAEDRVQLKKEVGAWWGRKCAD
jgi:hypothetical protein